MTRVFFKKKKKTTNLFQWSDIAAVLRALKRRHSGDSTRQNKEGRAAGSWKAPEGRDCNQDSPRFDVLYNSNIMLRAPCPLLAPPPVTVVSPASCRCTGLPKGAVPRVRACVGCPGACRKGKGKEKGVAALSAVLTLAEGHGDVGQRGQHTRPRQLVPREDDRLQKPSKSKAARGAVTHASCRGGKAARGAATP